MHAGPVRVDLAVRACFGATAGCIRSPFRLVVLFVLLLALSLTYFQHEVAAEFARDRCRVFNVLFAKSGFQLRGLQI